MTYCNSHHDLQWVIVHCNKNQSLTNWVIMTFIQWVIFLMTFIQWVIFDSLDSSVPHSSIRCYSRPACFAKLVFYFVLYLRLWADLVKKVNENHWCFCFFSATSLHVFLHSPPVYSSFPAGIGCQGLADSTRSKESLTQCTHFNCKCRIITIVWS